MITNIIASTQTRLKTIYGPRHYYYLRYAAEEMSYCGPIPIWIEEWMSNFSTSRVLDIGAGYGTLACVTSQLGGRVDTVDRLPLLSTEAAKEYGICRNIGDIERNFYPEGRYQTVIMTEVLEHFNFQPGPTLRKIVESLDGRLFLSTPDANSWGYIPGSEFQNLPVFNPMVHDFNNPPWRDAHVHQYREIELMALLDRCGLQVIRSAKSKSPGGEHFCLELGR